MRFYLIFAAIAAACLLVTAVPTVSPELTKRAVDFSTGSEKLRGLNIGGWLILEPWITPSIFQNVDQSLGIVDELTLCQKLPGQAPGILRHHWDTFATYDDFAKIKAAGFNLVRIPIGFWAYDNKDTAYVQGAAMYMDAAIDWCRVLGLKVIVDLHGVPGSQNGFDNSGQAMQDPFWMTDGGYQGPTAQWTLDILGQIAERYAPANNHDDVILAIELVNEPLGWPDVSFEDELRKFYTEGFNRVRHSSNTTVMIHDAFLGPKTFNNLLTPEKVIVDHHYYHAFDNGLLYMTPQQHRQFACSSHTIYDGSDKAVIIGEWTGAMTDCTPHLNGYKTGNRFEGTWENSTVHGKCAANHDIKTWSQQMRDDTRAFIEAQMDTFEQNSKGWVWWTFKTEAAAEWDAFLLMDEGIFPTPVTDRQVKNACGN
ncbi:hypothetical protein BLS_003903 [Venturia inaequalis]|uniref:Glycoside hydrolase family 5 domain-containing protein n=1 Tax=Venturia inaequalis TaxID=5025 RepID=A0A8H3YT50_VENIN|nr:hypothetical protein BLS_003903 [Venturia inaequalis]